MGREQRLGSVTQAPKLYGQIAVQDLARRRRPARAQLPPLWPQPAGARLPGGQPVAGPFSTGARMSDAPGIRFR